MLSSKVSKWYFIDACQCDDGLITGEYINNDYTFTIKM